MMSEISIHDWTERSLLLSIILDHILGSEGQVRARRDVIRIMNYIMNKLSPFQQMHPAGSRAEGLNMDGSDLDYMYEVPRVKVVSFNNLQIQSSPDDVLLTHSEGIHPGFVVLELVRLGGSGLVIPCCKKKDMYGTYYLSSEKFLAQRLNDVSFADDQAGLSSTSSHNYPHGPCVTQKKMHWDVEVDHAFCLRCTTWPPQADEWIHRHRRSGFPSPDLINRLTKLPCFVIPIGSKHSDSSALEWRLSFSMQEKEIIFNMNPTQFKVYGLLKTLLKEHFSLLVPDILCSYLLKTALFWLSEEIPIRCWKEKNLLFCWMACLQRILEWLCAGYCPNYFISDNNMLDGKTDEALRSAAEQINAQVTSEGWRVIFRCKSLEKFYWMFSYPHISIAVKVDTDNAERNEILRDFEVFCSRFSYSVGQDIESDLKTYLGILHTIKTDVSDVDAEVIEFKTLYIHEVVGTMYFALSHMCGSSNREKYHLLKAARYHLQLATKRDISEGNLKLATFHYTNGTYHLALSLVNRFLSLYGPYAVHVQTPVGGSIIYPNDDRNLFYKEKFCSKGLSITEKAQQALVNDVRFREHEYHYAPLVVQLELTILKTAGRFVRVILNHLAYAYYLSFCCYSEMNRPEECYITLGVLMDLLNSDQRVSAHHIYQVYNFAAYCHILLGDHVTAQTLLRQSLTIKAKLNPASILTVGNNCCIAMQLLNG